MASQCLRLAPWSFLRRLAEDLGGLRHAVSLDRNKGWSQRSAVGRPPCPPANAAQYDVDRMGLGFNFTPSRMDLAAMTEQRPLRNPSHQRNPSRPDATTTGFTLSVSTP